MSLTKATYSMIAGAPVSIIDFGASPSASAATNRAAIQAAIDSGASAVYIPAGQYQINDSIVMRSSLTMFGDGVASRIIFNGTVGVPAFKSGSTSGNYDVYLHDFDVYGYNNTKTHTLMDWTYLRYSSMENVGLYYAKYCMILTEAWGDTFRSCKFYGSGYDNAFTAQTYGVYFPFDALKTNNVANLSNFIACEVTNNEYGFYCQAIGRDVIFSGCGVEGNGYGWIFTGQGGSLNTVIQDCYIEANIYDHIRFVQNFSRSDENVVIKNNFVTVSDGTGAFIHVQDPGSGGHSMVVENNMYEQVGSSAPQHLYAVYMPSGQGNWYVNYQHNSRIVNTSTFATIEHFDWTQVDFRKFTSNIPYEVTYAVNPTTSNTFTSQGNDVLRVFVSNGTATITGTVKDASNAFAGFLSAATLPSTMDPNTSPAPLLLTYTPNANTDLTYGTAMINGQSVRFKFVSGNLNDYVKIQGTWQLALGTYVPN